MQLLSLNHSSGKADQLVLTFGHPGFGAKHRVWRL